MKAAVGAAVGVGYFTSRAIHQFDLGLRDDRTLRISHVAANRTRLRLSLTAPESDAHQKAEQLIPRASIGVTFLHLVLPGKKAIFCRETTLPSACDRDAEDVSVLGTCAHRLPVNPSPACRAGLLQPDQPIAQFLHLP